MNPLFVANKNTDKPHFCSHFSSDIHAVALHKFYKDKSLQFYQTDNNNNNMNELENFKFMFHMSSVINCIADKRKDQITTKNSPQKMKKENTLNRKVNSENKKM